MSRFYIGRKIQKWSNLGKVDTYFGDHVNVVEIISLRYTYIQFNSRIGIISHERISQAIIWIPELQDLNNSNGNSLWYQKNKPCKKWYLNLKKEGRIMFLYVLKMRVWWVKIHLCISISKVIRIFFFIPRGKVDTLR